jgi:hypothetical protein
LPYNSGKNTEKPQFQKSRVSVTEKAPVWEVSVMEKAPLLKDQ